MTDKKPPTITAAQAADLYSDGEGVDGDTIGGWTLVGQAQEHQERQSRWHQRYWLVVRDGQGDTYGLSYGLGLTENQDHNFPWPYYGDSSVPDDRELPLTRLYAHTVTKTVYRREPAKDGQ